MPFRPRHLLCAPFVVIAGCGGGGGDGSASAASDAPMPPAPLETEYGSDADHAALAAAVRGDDPSAVAAVIQTAIRTRGRWAGCAVLADATVVPDPAVIAPAAVRTAWERIHAPGLAAADTTRPLIGREAGMPALGGFYAALAGGTADQAALTRIVDLLGDQQYGPRTVSGTLTQRAGIFGYVFVQPGDPWYRGGIVGTTLATLHERYPDLFATYDRGPFAGYQFLVADTRPASGFYDGGIDFDQGWAGVAMIEAALQLPEAAARERCRAAALLAGEWALGEPLVSNHNYVAKLVWLLAELYAWTGDTRFRDGCVRRLRMSLEPALLMDANGDGVVDGVSDLRFAALTPYAQRPGRPWDGHNASPWYTAMVATGLVEAYVALRDRGDGALAAEVRPYAFAILDNIAWEQGRWRTFDPTVIGFRDIPLPLLLGLWRIARFEGQPQPEWERAAAALWNVRPGQSFGGFTAAAGLYLVLGNGTEHVPLRLRRPPGPG